ncbi:MAG: hypothetical protein EBT07_04630 [Actinobacteria bacterium]|nr:hypothetical protein [Actinomycetota bacterium]
MLQNSSVARLNASLSAPLVKRLGILSNSLIFAAAISAIAVMLIRWLIFPLGTINADELIYQEMAGAFLNGQTKIPVDPVLGPQSAPWLMSNIGNWSVPKYQPLFPLFLISAELLGLWFPLSALAFACTYSVGKLAAAFSVPSVRAAWLWNASSIFLITASTALPYVFSLELGILILLVAASSKRYPFLKLGILIGLGLLCRPMDTVLFALAGTSILWQRRKLSSSMDYGKLILVIGVASIPAFGWNWIQTGSPLEFPFSLTSRLDSWGFGVRKIYDSDPGLDFTVLNGLEAIFSNVGRILTWTFGGIVLLPLAFVSLRRGHLKYRLSLIILALSWLVAYGCFWGSFASVRFWNGPDYIGPFYWLPLSLILVLLISANPQKASEWKFPWVAAAVVAALVFFSVISKNWAMTESWKSSDLLKQVNTSDSIIKIDKSYSSHIGAPIQIVANRPGVRKFSTNWQGLVSMVDVYGVRKPQIWLAMGHEETRFDFLPFMARVKVASSAPVVEINDANWLQLQIVSDSGCVFKSVSPSTKLKLNLSIQSLNNGFTGTCSERSEANELVFKLISIRSGKTVHTLISYFDPKSQNFYYAVF